MKEEYDPSKLFSVDVKSRTSSYRSNEPLISLNTKNANFSLNKKAIEVLSIMGIKRLKLWFLCDGFKLYADSAVERDDENFMAISKSNVGCSMGLCLELKKHYELKGECRAVFSLIEVEKHRFRLDLKKTDPLKKKIDKL